MHKRVARGLVWLPHCRWPPVRGRARREHPIYWYGRRPAGRISGNRAKAWPEDRASFEEGCTAFFLARVRRASQGGEINILALSGGRCRSGRSAPVPLTGLGNAGTRPLFSCRDGSGVPGALTAAIRISLGPAWDAKLTESFSGQRFGRSGAVQF